MKRLGRKNFMIGAADYLTGASNSRKRSRDSTLIQPLDDDEEVEDAGENPVHEK